MYWKKLFIVKNEFDPGSEKTQGTCLTHANFIVNLNYSELVSNIWKFNFRLEVSLITYGEISDKR